MLQTKSAFFGGQKLMGHAQMDQQGEHDVQ